MTIHNFKSNPNPNPKRHVIRISRAVWVRCIGTACAPHGFLSVRDRLDLLFGRYKTGTPGKGNRFQPKKRQVTVLRNTLATVRVSHPSLVPFSYRGLSNRQWLNSFRANPFLYWGLDEVTIRDEEARALAIVEELCRTGQRHVTMMDGHGRMLHKILSCIQECVPAILDEVTFSIIDLDRTVHAWHELFFPSSVQNFCANLFDVPEMLTGIVYLNFCSIGGSAERLIGEIRRLTENGQSVMLSYTTRAIVYLEEPHTVIQAIHHVINRDLQGARPRPSPSDVAAPPALAPLASPAFVSSSPVINGILEYRPWVRQVFFPRPDHAFDGRFGFNTYLIRAA
jgi:hypothetical protein